MEYGLKASRNHLGVQALQNLGFGMNSELLCIEGSRPQYLGRPRVHHQKKKLQDQNNRCQEQRILFPNYLEENLLLGPNITFVHASRAMPQ